MIAPCDALERVAAALHEGWAEYNREQGRVVGPERTSETHPHLVPWEGLDCTSQNQDRFVAAVILDAWLDGRLSVAALPEAIHEAWRRWIALNGRNHPHDKPFHLAHPNGGDEHCAQAAYVRPLLEALDDVCT